MIKKLIAGLIFVAYTTIAMAVPTFALIEDTINKKDYPAAEMMLDEVIKARPDSVRAHSLKASVLMATGADQNRIAAELAYANKSNKEVVVEIQQKPDYVKNILIAAGIVATIIAGFLGWEYKTILSRRKKVIDTIKQGETSNEEDFSYNYIDTLSSHSIRAPGSSSN